jgi:hypothetical protein
LKRYTLFVSSGPRTPAVDDGDGAILNVDVPVTLLRAVCKYNYY